MVHFFPYVLCRLGGESLTVMRPQHTYLLQPQFINLIEQEADYQTQKEALSDALLTYIRQQEGSWQKQVHNFRRDLYNDRPIKPLAEAALLAQLPSSLQEQIQAFRTAAEAIRQLRQVWQTTYQTALLACRADLQALASHEPLRQGLVLSSPDLLAKLDGFGLIEPQAFRKRDSRTEQSLLKYLARMVAKTSPFSTFTNLAIGRVHLGANSCSYQLLGDPKAPIQSHVRLNNTLYKYIRDLIWAYRPLCTHVGLRVNPTLRQQQQQWVYLTNVSNIESFQRLPVQPVLKATVDLLGTGPTLTIGRLVTELGELVEASASALETFIRQLIEFGFLELVWPSSGMDPNWDVALVAWLEQLTTHDIPLASDLSQGLVALRRQADRFGSLPSATRLPLLEAAHNDFRALYWRIHEAAGLPAEERRTPDEMVAAYRKAQNKAEVDKTAATGPDTPSEPSASDSPVEKPSQPFRYRPMTTFMMLPKQLFYEDTVRPVQAAFEADELQGWVEQLDLLTHQLRGGMWSSSEPQQMHDFFARFYSDQSTIPLLTFYEDYYREVQLPAEEKRRQTQANAPGPVQANPDGPTQLEPSTEEATENVPPADAPLSTNSTTHDPLDEQLARVCLTKLQQATLARIDIAPTDIAAALTAAAVTLPPPEPIASRAAFVQFYTEQNQLMGVVNNGLTGWGRLLSRFLHILGPDVLPAQRTWNAQFGDGLLLTECVDASYFNANIHPPLMPYELQLPNGHCALPAGQQLPVADFHLRVTNKTLQLVHLPTGLPTYCFDLGFQGPAGRSALFKLLTQFSLPGYASFYRLTHAVNRAAAQLQLAEGIQHYPRVVYNQQIVLQRRHWRVRLKDTPQREPLEIDAAYALRLLRWCRQLGIPNEVFVVLNQERDGYQPTSDQLQKLTRDDYKPQYIDFGHPLLVLLFEKMLAKAPGGYRIEEMLPGPDDMVRLGDNPTVSECLIQWYTHQPQ